MTLLDIQEVSRSFYGVRALQRASMQVEAGKITGLIGPNGAGKTTLFGCITGLVPVDHGKIVFDGHDITGLRPDRITAHGLVRTFQIARGLPRMSVLENLLLYGAAQPGEQLWQAIVRTAAMRAREDALIERAAAVAKRLNLLRVIHDPATALSGGQKKLLEIGRALMTEPKLILLDEPIAGVNPTLAREIGVHLRALVAEGITILLIEHHMDMVARLCDHVVVLAEGHRLAQGSFETIADDPEVQQAYMGRRHTTAA